MEMEVKWFEKGLFPRGHADMSQKKKHYSTEIIPFSLLSFRVPVPSHTIISYWDTEELMIMCFSCSDTSKCLLRSRPSRVWKVVVESLRGVQGDFNITRGAPLLLLFETFITRVHTESSWTLRLCYGHGTVTMILWSWSGGLVLAWSWSLSQPLKVFVSIHSCLGHKFVLFMWSWLQHQSEESYSTTLSSSILKLLFLAGRL